VQGFDATNSIVNQDNQSVILLEKNGRALSSKHTRHTNIRNFFLADRIVAIASKKGGYSTAPWQNGCGILHKAASRCIIPKVGDFIMNVDLPVNNLSDQRSVLSNEKATTIPCRRSEPRQKSEIQHEATE
jgi:hypothetical protein